jgi:hypothetical protein
MSSLVPGGSRAKGSRLFTPEAIKAHVQRQKRDYSAGAETSPAGRPHTHSREVERRLRQEARRQK